MKLMSLGFVVAICLCACPDPKPDDRCGDGEVKGKETCDDGNTKDGDGCSAKCAMEMDWHCSGTPSSCIKNKQSLGLGACINGAYDGTSNDDPDLRCHTFRAISGVSMGGGSAARVGATYPELFDVIGVMGTPFSDYDYFFHMIRHKHMSGFCPREQILANLDDVDRAEGGSAFCGPVQFNDYAIPDSECRIFPSSFNSWFRGPDEGRGGGFSRNGLIEIFHDLSYAYGNAFQYNPDSAILPPSVPETWRIPLGIDRQERDQLRAQACDNPEVVNGVYNLEYNPDASYPAVTFCDGALGDTGDYWPDHHRFASGPAGVPDGRFHSPQLFPGQTFTFHYKQRGRYRFHCSEHPATEPALRVNVTGEACDDGNTSDGDGCSATCLTEPGFVCSGTSCSSSCGNGTVDPSEQCDDGGTADNDGCAADCTIEAGYACGGTTSSCAQTCGNGALDFGEFCDDSNTTNGDGCSQGCLVEPGFRCTGPGDCAQMCGDGILDEGEYCDDDNLTDNDGCSGQCTIEPGYSCIGAPSDCANRCGDGTIDQGESCDDGANVAGDGCDALCALEPGYTCSGQPSSCATSRCGNNGLNPGEGCDDGDLEAGDGCSPWCEIEPGYKCSGNPSTCTPSCGDGTLDPVDASYFCGGGQGICHHSLSHNQGFGTVLTVRPQQQLRLSLHRTHNIPIEFGLAVDYNNNGRRDYAEPVIDNSEERYQDHGVDTCPSPEEDGSGGCSAQGPYDPVDNPDPNGDDYHYLTNPGGTENNFRYDQGETTADDGLDGVPATGDFGEGDGSHNINPYLEAALAQSPRRQLALLDDAAFDRIDWWLDAGMRDFINSAQVTNQLWGYLHSREPNTRVFDGEPTVPGYSENDTFWFLTLDYSPEAIGKNAYLRYGDPSFCPGVDEVFGSGNHVGPGNQVLERLYTLLTFATYRMPDGDFSVVQQDFDTLGPSGQLSDFTRLEHMNSDALGREIEYGLVLPPDYYINPEARYPVVYFMHGQGQSAADLVLSGIVFFTNQKESFLEERVAEGRSDWQKKIIVFVDGECREQDCYTGNFYVNFRGMPEGRQFEDAFIELMQHIDTTYRTKHPQMLPK